MAAEVEWPSVAVVVPTFNSARYLAEALLSVREQTHREIDIWVLDGDSSDGTVQLAEALPFQVITVVDDSHPALRIDHWLTDHRDEYHFLAIQHSDDIAHPRRIEWQLKAFEEDPSLTCVSGGYQPFRHDPVSFGFARDPLVLVPTRHDDILAQLPFWWVRPAPTLMFSLARLRQRVFCLHNHYRFCNDWWTSVDLAFTGARLGNCPHPIQCYRRHGDSDGPRHLPQVEAEQAAISRRVLQRCGFEFTEKEFALHRQIHLEGGALWQGSESDRPRAVEWCLRLLAQNSRKKSLPEAAFAHLVGRAMDIIIPPP